MKGVSSFNRRIEEPPEVLSTQELLRRDPKNQKGILFLAHYFKSIGNVSESLKYYDQLLDYFPDELVYYQEKAGLCLDSKDYSGAVDTLVALSEKDPENYFVFYNLGLAYFHSGQIRSAIRSFEEAYVLTQDPQVEEEISEIIKQLSDI